MNARFSSVYVAATLMGLVASAHAQTTIQLGTATGYAVLAGSTITNTGASLVTGDIGLSPGTAITGFPPGIIAGATRIAAAAAPAQTDSLAAYNDAFGRPVGTTVTTELGGQTLVAGVYSTASGTLGLTGTLTLDGQNNPNAVFIFKAASTMITASGAPGTPASLVVLRGGAQACNVFCQIGSSTTLGSYSAFQGSVLAAASITANTGASVNGRLLARTGAVTLDTNAVTTPVCNGSIQIVKNTVGGDGTFAFTGNTGVTSLTTVGGTGSQTINLAPGSGYNATETVPAGWTQTGASCTNGTPAAIQVVSGGTTVCTFTNTIIPALPPGSIRVVKNTSGGNGTFAFTSNFGLTTLTTVAGAATQTFTNLVIGSNYSVSEAASAGWTQTSATCTNGTPAAVVVTAGGTTVCTFINTAILVPPPPASGSLTIVKSSIGGNGTFAFNSNFGFSTLTTAGGTATQVFTNLAPGVNYFVSETASAGWTQTSTACTNGTPAAVIVISGGATVCTFINTAIVVPPPPPATGVVTIVKSSIGGNGTFTFTSNFGFTTLTTASGTATQTFTNLTPGSNYSATETATAGWTQTSATCTNGSPSAIIVTGGGVTVCTFINTVVPAVPPGVPDLIITKTHAGNFRQGDIGDTYTLHITNIGAVATTGIVSVTDNLPAGLLATAIAGLGWNCVSGSLVCTRSDALAPGASYPDITVTVNVSGNGADFKATGATLFQADDLFVSMADGTVQWRRNDFSLVKVLPSTTDGQAKGAAFNGAGSLFVTHWFGASRSGNEVAQFTPTGTYSGVFGSGYNCNPSSITFDNSGNAYVGQADCGAQILKFDSRGKPAGAFSVALEKRGTYDIGLDPNQCTMYYSSEGPNVKRFDVCTNRQLTDFNSGPLPDAVSGAFALLPDGGMLVANSSVISRLDAQGYLVGTYDSPDHNCWLGMALDTDGKTFWSSDWCTSSVTHFDIASGVALDSQIMDSRGYTVKRITIRPNTFNVTATNTATVQGGGETNVSNNTARDVTNIAPPPVPPGLASMVNAASGNPGVTPGSLASVFGNNLASGQAVATTLPLPVSLAGSSLQLNDRAAPLFFASPSQVNLQIPWETRGDTPSAGIVTLGGGKPTALTIHMVRFNPGIFALNAAGSGQGIVVVAGTLLLAGLAGPGSTPALKGGFITIYATGLGPVSNQPATGNAALLSGPLSFTLSETTAMIGGVSGDVSFSGLAPGLVGVYQINVKVPDGVASGNAVPVTLAIGGVTSNTVTIAVQ